MSESKELVLVQLPAPADLEAAFISDEYISNLIADIRQKALSVVGDVNTVKGRGVYISMASTVRRTKTAIDDAGKNLVAEMKKRPALVDASRKKVRDALDELAVEIRRPATEWEAEQERIKAEAEAKEAARLAEEKRIADEAASRAADVEHRRAINAAAVQALIDQGIPEDWAKACVVAIARGKIPATTINY
nr:hypothetical protein PGH06_12800 [Citrobacter braakii]